MEATGLTNLAPIPLFLKQLIKVWLPFAGMPEVGDMKYENPEGCNLCFFQQATNTHLPELDDSK